MQYLICLEVGWFFFPMDSFNGTQRKVRLQPGCGGSLPEGPEQPGWAGGWHTQTGSALAAGGDHGGSQDVTAWHDERELSPSPTGLS